MKGLENFKCPKCGGPVNRWQVAGIKKGKIVLVFECWSGDTQTKSFHHLYTGTLSLFKTLKAKEDKRDMYIMEAQKLIDGMVDFLVGRHFGEFNPEIGGLIEKLRLVKNCLKEFTR